ncbi:hypothetical protein LTR37_016396 [Vermiconidia calcicola]|uniref:Uncharacterized protein n=1 Tax=Vermiconidia calcicola TaxID=1690605 RepID=A0ACC3MPG1_9PEZI|nr:hypothetical protein LTR37_016396 [Vermiconidia calcicola]
MDQQDTVDEVTRAMSLNTMPDNHANAAKQPQDQDSGNANEAFDADSMPVLALLGGENVAQLDVDGLMDQVFESIQARRRHDPGMATLGRTACNFRIDYDPESTKIDGIQDRIFALATSGGCTREFLGSVELLLRPFVSWNKTAFPVIAHERLPHKLKRNEAAHRQTWAHYPVEDRESLEPFVYSRRGTIISGMTEMWTLVGTGGHLAEDIEAIFEFWRRPEEYKDSLEQALYVFMINNSRAVLGRAAGERF